jgi:hypothetical protein
MQLRSFRPWNLKLRRLFWHKRSWAHVSFQNRCDTAPPVALNPIRDLPQQLVHSTRKGIAYNFACTKFSLKDGNADMSIESGFITCRHDIQALSLEVVNQVGPP